MEKKEREPAGEGDPVEVHRVFPCWLVVVMPL
jgi:hypothetical protein